MAANRWRLEGQLALVTGASAGIGLAITRELLGFGADVLMVARDADALQDARQDLAEEFPEREISVLAADVADDEDRRAILDWVEDHAEGLNILAHANIGMEEHARDAETAPLTHPDYYRYDLDLAAA